MKATLNGYTPDTQLINVYAGQTAPYYPTLQQSPPPPRSTGTVYAKSSPSGANVYVDGTYNGVTPMTLTLYPGNHNIVLKLSGYNDWSTTVYVTAGSSQTINPSLTPAIFGSLSIGSAPAGASVFMDSAYQGITNPSGGLTLNNIPSGSHIIKVTASGYNDWIETVYVKPNANTYVPVVMTRIGPSPTPVPAAGAINIVSTPAGAEIYIDNIFRGYTPATITEIDPGLHQILLTVYRLYRLFRHCHGGLGTDNPARNRDDSRTNPHTQECIITGTPDRRNGNHLRYCNRVKEAKLK